MGQLTHHWTEESTENFLYRIAFDYIRQIEQAMEADGGTNQSELSAALGVSPGRVSQVLNNPGNLTLKNVVQYARALRRKVAIVVYDDGDPDNHNGPLNPEIFSTCWEAAGRPTDFFEMYEPVAASSSATTDAENVTIRKVPGAETYYISLLPHKANTMFELRDCGVLLGTGAPRVTRGISFMAEAKQLTFSYKEVVECLVKQQGLNEGIWGLFVKFGINAANIGPNQNDIRPAAIIPVLEIGLQRMDEETNISVDAAKVNPKAAIKRRTKSS